MVTKHLCSTLVPRNFLVHNTPQVSHGYSVRYCIAIHSCSLFLVVLDIVSKGWMRRIGRVWPSIP